MIAISFPVLITIIWTAVIHPFHISVCEIFYNQEANSLEVTHKLFWDDFQAELSSIHGQNLTYGSWKQDQPEIIEYFSTNFAVWIDKSPTDIQFLGFEIENEAMWCYLEITGVQRFEAVKIRNTVLTGLFDDQENIVHFTKQDQIKSLKLDRRLPEGDLRFQ